MLRLRRRDATLRLQRSVYTQVSGGTHGVGNAGIMGRYHFDRQVFWQILGTFAQTNKSTAFPTYKEGNDMRRWMAACMAVLLVLLCLSATAESTGQTAEPVTQDDAVVTSAADIAKLGRPVSATPTHVTVGNSTQVSGQFFTDMWGNNTSDIDVRTLLHGYNLVAWSSQVQFVADPMVVQAVTNQKTKGNMVYTIALQTDLTYNDGQTAITAKDYVFSLLLCTSPQMATLGADASRYEHIVGYDAYHSGKSKGLSGVRLIDDHTFSIAIKGDYQPFFFDLATIWCIPYPRSVLAPGCDVVDTKNGVQLANENANQPLVPFSAEILQQTILDQTTGYMYHPALTSGPYQLTAYDAATGQVDFALNPYYKGNYEGVKPVIDTLTLLPAKTDTMVQELAAGDFDLLNKCVNANVIIAGLALRDQGIQVENYARMGYGFASFACEKGPQQFVAVRQAIAYCVDKDAFVTDFLQGFGLPVYGYYGMGQWTTLAAMGSLRPDAVTAKDGAKWDKITLDNLNHYDVNTEQAQQLLVKDKWVLNANGEKFVQGVDDVRYKKVGKELMRLSIHFAQAEGNDAAALLAKQLQDTLPALGFEIKVDVVPFTQVLADYYRENGERLYDMSFLASNFLSVFDPYTAFRAEGGQPDTANVSGLNDKKLTQLALKMNKTAPLDYLTYEQNWLAFQERYNEILPTLPLYSNVYFDLHTNWLQNYVPSSYSSWPAAILYAYYAEPTTETTTVDTLAPQDTPAEGEIIFED